MEKIKTSISLDKDVYEKIKKLAQDEDRSFSQQVNKILKDYVK
jgi:predicted CopG family antitoxin